MKYLESDVMCIYVNIIQTIVVNITSVSSTLNGMFTYTFC